MGLSEAEQELVGQLELMDRQLVAAVLCVVVHHNPAPATKAQYLVSGARI